MSISPYCRHCGSPLSSSVCAVCGSSSQPAGPCITLAGPLRRVGATLLDYLVVAFGLSVLTSSMDLTNNVFQVLSSIVMVLYITVMTTWGSGTLGNRVAKTQVTTLSGAHLSLPRAAARALLCRVGDIALIWCALHNQIPTVQEVLNHPQSLHLPPLVYVATIAQLLDYAAVLVTAQRQTLHDMLCRTLLRRTDV